MSSSLPSENFENTCVVCFKNVFLFSIGECDHPVCYECSTRMRVLCRQNECPICRQDMPKVVFTRDVQPFRNIKNRNYLMDKKFKICFDSADIQAAYSKLLEHVCKKCPNRPAFRTFQNLKDHVKKEHEMFYCDLCVDNLKIFTGERRCYSRQELAQHRRKGDPDDKSHRGHPLCEFCDQRYMDNDELFRHLRRDHLFCHFCDADGFHQYYSSYDFLREHFRADHYLCEEGGCVEEKFTSAFRSEIDLKAHRASVHGRSMGKAAAKQARTLELEFTLAPRPRDGARGARRGGGSRPRSVQEEESQGAIGGRNHSDEVFQNASGLNTNCIEEFPTLNGSASAGPPLRPNSRQVSVNNSALTIRTLHQSQAPLAVNDANFPALGSDMSGGGCKTVRLSVNSGSNTGASSKVPANVSIHVNHRPTHLSSSQKFRVHPRSEAEFPSLSTPQGNMGVRNKSQTPPLVNPRPSKKASSLTIPVSCSWSAAQGTNEPSVGNIKVRSKKKKPNKNTNNILKVADSEEMQKINPLDPSKSAVSREEEISLKLQGILKCTVERKRSELVIGNLASEEEDCRLEALSDSCPPGFQPHCSKSTPAPPPGFGSDGNDTSSLGIKSPPPGFSVTLNSVARPQSNGLTFTNSSGQSYSIMPDKKRQFIPPDDSEKRNQVLVTKVQNSVDDMEEFLQMSALFRQGSVSAYTFYEHCMRTMGHEAFTDVFPELLVLLPDVEKQQDLLAVYSAVSGEPGTTFQVCAVCDQVLSLPDVSYHQGRHLPSRGTAIP